MWDYLISLYYDHSIEAYMSRCQIIQANFYLSILSVNYAESFPFGLFMFEGTLTS